MIEIEQFERYLAPHLVSLQIIVIGADACTEMLYDMMPKDQNSVFICIDRNRDLIKKMMLENMTQRPKLKWRVTIPDSSRELLESCKSLVIDNGALSAEAEIQEYLNRVQSLGDKYICFLPLDCNSGIIGTLLEHYRVGHKASFQESAEENNVMIVIQKVEIRLPFMIEHDKIQNGILYDLISGENVERLQILDESSLLLTDIEAGVMGNPYIISAGRNYLLKYEQSDSGEYHILVLDVDAEQHFHNSWHIFFTTQAEGLMFASKEDISRTDSHARASRVYVVLLSEIQEHLDTKILEKDLEPVFQRLAPVSTVENSKHVSSKITMVELLTFLEKVDDVSGIEEVEDLNRGSDGGEFDKRSNMVVDGQEEDDNLNRGSDVGECSENSNTALDMQQKVDNNCCCVKKTYDLNLTQWLSTNHKRWDDTCDAWNSKQFRKSSRLENVPSWNSSRPTEGCSNIISGILNAVFDYHSEHEIHGHGRLMCTDNYLISFRKYSICGSTYNEARVIIDNGGKEEACHLDDRIVVGNLIFSDILKDRKELPRIWLDLKTLLLKPWRNRAVGANTKYLRDHPACWNWYRRYEYIEKIWMQIHLDKIEEPNVKFNVYDAINSSKFPKDWKSMVPKNTPLHRMLEDNIYADESFHYFRYIRNLCTHIREQEKIDDTYVFKYIKEGKEGDDLTYGRNQFVEVVITECFGYQLKLFKEMMNRDVEI